MYPHAAPQVGKRSKVIDIENALKLANADGVVTYDEIRQNLKKWDFHLFVTFHEIRQNLKKLVFLVHFDKLSMMR